MDLTNDFPDRLTGTIHTFDITAVGNNLRVWTATPTKINQYQLNPTNAQFRFVGTLALPKQGKTPTDLDHPGTGSSIIVEQGNRLYQYSPNEGGFQQFRNIFTSYDSENWEKLSWKNYQSAVKVIPPEGKKIWSKLNSSKPRWRLKTNDNGNIDFFYKSDTLIRRFNPLKTALHTFQKDIIHDIASPNSLFLLMATEEGLLQYDPYGEKTWRPMTDTDGNKMEGIDQIYTLNGMFWLRQDGDWKRASLIKNKLSLEKSPLLQTVHFDSTQQLLWTQLAPGKTQITLGEKDIADQNKLATNQLVDLVAADTNIFISTKGAIWQLADVSRLGELQLSATIPNAKFYQYNSKTVYAISPEAGTFLFTEEGWQKTTSLEKQLTRVKNYTLSGCQWQMEEGKSGVTPFSNRQIREMDHGIFRDDIISDAIPYSNGYWMASCGGIWFMARSSFRTARGKTMHADKSFTYFFKDGYRIFVVDSQDKVYEYTNRKWVEIPGMRPNQLTKGISTGNVCFVQNGDEITLERSDDKVGPVWANNALIGDGVTEYTIFDDHLWGLLPGKGLARYQIDIDFIIRLDTFYKETFGDYPPVKGHLLHPPNSDALYFKTEYQNWIIRGDSLTEDDSGFWEKPLVTDKFGKTEWYRSTPLADEVQLRINGKNVPAAFVGNRMAFDDYKTVYANGDGSFWLGTTTGLYRFLHCEFGVVDRYFFATPSRSVLMDFFPEPEGIEAITEKDGYLYIINGQGQQKILTANGFEDSQNAQAFQLPVPKLTLSDGSIKWKQVSSPGSKYANSWEVTLPEDIPIFNPYGTFTFDQFKAAAAISDSSWLGATSVGLMAYNRNDQGHWTMKSFYPYSNLKDSISTVSNIQNTNNDLFLHATNQKNQSLFYQWSAGRLQAYNESQRGIFNNQQLVFSPEKMQWDLQVTPFDSIQALIVDSEKPYELFKSDLNDNQKGRFAFDALYNLHVDDHILTAESEGGTIIYRFQPEAEAAEDRLVFQSFTIVEEAETEDEPSSEKVDSFANISYEPIFQKAGLEIQREKGSLRQVIKWDDNFEWKAYALPVPERQLNRIEDTLYYLEQDSFLYKYDLETNSKKRIEALYIAGSETSFDDFIPPLEMGRYDNNLVIIDHDNQRYGLTLIQNDSIWLNSDLESSLLFYIGELIFKDLGGQLIIRGRDIPPMLLDEKPYAIAWRDQKLWFCQESATKCTVIQYNRAQDNYSVSIQGASFIQESGLYVDGDKVIHKFPEKNVSYELLASLGPAIDKETVISESLIKKTTGLVAIKNDRQTEVYEVSDGGQLLINGRMVSATNDILFKTRINNVVDMKKGRKRIWVATPRKLIQIKE